MVASQANQKRYLNALIKEFKYYQNEYSTIETIYIGGGTPSYFDRESLRSLLNEIKLSIPLSQIVEYTIEANPHDVDDAFIELIKQSGINRLSIGMQTSQPQLLKMIGRTHSFEDVKKAVQVARNHELNNLSLDIIYAIPGETLDDLKSDIESAILIHPTHLSVYSLILEEKTKLDHDVRLGLVEMVDEDTEAEMADYVLKTLEANHYSRYEISNYAILNHQSLHNLGYWNLDEYIGIGMGAASLFHNQRTKNYSTLKSYIEQVDQLSIGTESIEDFNPQQETVLLGLRKTEGIDLMAFQKQFQLTVFEAYPQLESFIKQGLLHINQGRLKLTSLGMMLSNQVFLSLF